MKTLNDLELLAVAGGDRWYMETQDGKANYEWATPSFTEGLWLDLAFDAARSGESMSLCHTEQIGPATAQTCYNQDGTVTMQSCLNAGPSASVGGVGLGATANLCTTRSLENWR